MNPESTLPFDAAALAALPSRWTDARSVWARRTEQSPTWEAPAALDHALNGLLVTHRTLGLAQVRRIVAEGVFSFNGTVAVGSIPAKEYAQLSETPTWKQVRHLTLWKESSLHNLVGLPLEHIESISFRDVEPKAQKLPPLDLPALTSLTCPGLSKNLKKLFKAYSLGGRLTNLTLTGGINKPNTFVFQPGVIENLEYLSLSVMANPVKMVTWFEDSAFSKLRHLELFSNKLNPNLAEVLTNQSWWTRLQTLRLLAPQTNPRQLGAFLTRDLPDLQTLELANLQSYGGLSKADPTPRINSALARTQRTWTIENLFLGWSEDPKPAVELAQSSGFPNLRRLYIQHRGYKPFDVQSPIAPVERVLAEPSTYLKEPDMTQGLAPLLALGNRGVQVFIGR